MNGEAHTRFPRLFYKKMNIFQKAYNNIGEFISRKGYTGIFDTLGGKTKSNYGAKSTLEL